MNFQILHGSYFLLIQGQNRPDIARGIRGSPRPKSPNPIHRPGEQVTRTQHVAGRHVVAENGPPGTIVTMPSRAFGVGQRAHVGAWRACRDVQAGEFRRRPRAQPLGLEQVPLFDQLADFQPASIDPALRRLAVGMPCGLMGIPRLDAWGIGVDGAIVSDGQESELFPCFHAGKNSGAGRNAAGIDRPCTIFRTAAAGGW